MKVIQISSTSPSFFLNSGKGCIEDILKDDWYAQVAKQIKKFSPEIEIECWVPEKNYKKEIILTEDRIKFRMFPSALSIRSGMELAFSMTKALKNEIKEANKKNKKLILHFHEYHSWQTYLMLYFIKKNKNIKILAQHHGGRCPFRNLKRYKKLFLALPLIILMQFFENLLFKKVDVFYALSDSEIEYLKNKTKGKVKFQTMGIGREFFKKQNKNKARMLLNLDEKKKYILYVGRIKANKGIREMINAMKKLEKEKKAVELLLMGHGPDFEKYKGYVKKSKIGNVEFLGPIYGARRLIYFDACDYFILPSFTEGAPVVLMEAIAKNLPVVATDVGGVKKMIANGREGIIIKPKSSQEIVKAIKQVLIWKNKNIRKYAEKYKWEKIAKETIKEYENL